jgi:hypothetical protein
MVNKFTNQPTVKEVVTKINDVIDAVNQGGGGGGVSDVKVNNTSVVTSGVANIDLTGYAKTSNLATVATSGSYNDLSNKPTIPDAQVQCNWTETNTSSKAYIKNKPTIPTVNNATLTIQKNGTTVKTFTANASSNVTCNITVPTNTNELTNGAGFITGIGSADVINALGYTPYSASNPNGYTSNIGTITGIKMNGSSKGTSGVVNLGTVITAHQDISGKQDKITSTNKLSADLVSDGTTNKTVTATEKTTWNNKLDSSAISDMATKTWVGQQGYTSNIGTVTSVNNIQPDSNGNVAISATGGANIDLSNLSSTGEAHFLKVIEKAGNNQAGYRIYSDGYCVQWGYVASSSSNRGNYVVTFTKKYSDKNYKFIAHAHISSSPSSSTSGLQTNTARTYAGVTSENNARTVNSINLLYISDYWQIEWIVMGYLASGEY